MSKLSNSEAAAFGNQPRPERKPRISEDWLSLWTGLAVFLLSLGVFLGADLLGFGAKVGTWTDLSKAITPVAASFKWMPAWLAVVSTYLFMGLVVGVGNWLLGGNLKKFSRCLHAGLRHQFRLLGVGQSRPHRGDHAGGVQEVRHWLVAEVDGRGRLCPRPAGRAW